MKINAHAGRWLIILPPLLFLLVFFLIPFGFALKISFAEAAARVPPFTDILTRSADNHLQLTLSPANYQYLLSIPLLLTWPCPLRVSTICAAASTRSTTSCTIC